MVCFEDGYCPELDASEDEFLNGWAAFYGIEMTGAWALDDKWSILNGVKAIGGALAEAIDSSNPDRVFKDIFGSLTFKLKKGAKDGLWSCEASIGGFTCDPDSNGKIDPRLVAHELGHVFNRIISNTGQVTPYDDLLDASIRDDYGNWVTGINDDGAWERGYVGYNSKGKPDLYHGPDDWSDAATATKKEEYADMFMNWVFNSFDYTDKAFGAGTARYNWMTTNMAEWIDRGGK